MQGSSGLAGETRPKGDKGDPGPQGHVGPTGATGPAGTGLATTWANIDRPLWTNHFSWENIEPFMSPLETTNVDIVMLNFYSAFGKSHMGFGSKC